MGKIIHCLEYNTIMSTVCILTSAHSPFDQRIFHKQAQTLVSGGYDVTLIAHHDKKESREGINIVPISPSTSEFERMVDLFRIFKKAKDIEADIYHIHDPTLLPFAAALSYCTDAKVIYDVHEDYSEVLQFYSVTPGWSKPLINRLWPKFESTLTAQLDGVIGATEYISEIFRDLGHSPVTTIHNFPKLSSMSETTIPIERKSEYVLIFTGGISELRGLSTMLELTSRLNNEGYDVSLWLLGSIGLDGGERELRRRLEQEDHTEYVRYLGEVDHSKVHSYQRVADVGLVLVPKRIGGERYYRRGIPTKMIEYMYAELPVVASDTIGIKQYLPDECGVIVPSDKIEVQTKAVRELLESPQNRERMGVSGRIHVENEMSWSTEEEELLGLYDQLLR